MLSLFVLSTASSAAEARIDDVVVSTKPAFTVSFLVKDAFTKEVEEAIRSGIPVSFTYIIELRRLNPIWFNEAVSSLEVVHAVKYDTLKDEFEITLGEKGNGETRTSDFGEMKRIMSTGDRIPVYLNKALLAGEEYEVRIKAELKASKLPFLINYILYFGRLWDYETEWHSYRFSR